MNILILEDEDHKLNAISGELNLINTDIKFTKVDNFSDFMRELFVRKYDLIIADLIVPRFRNDNNPVDVTDSIIEQVRDIQCINFYTPVLALSQFADEEIFTSLNNHKVIVITYSDTNDWREALKRIVTDNMPKPQYDFVIICALAKETQGFIDAGYEIGESEIIQGLDCRKISISNVHGVIVTCPRMGLVTCSIVASKAIEYFDPNLICMSGICAGINSKVAVYDIVIPEICHQHDFGKWGNKGFEPEHYSVQLKHATRTSIQQFIKRRNFLDDLVKDISIKRQEIPNNCDEIKPNVILAPASSGSAVIADDNMNEVVKVQHRKMTAFEMETFAVYEAARLSTKQIDYFSAKCVVDDGGESKSDDYHRIACILSAKAVYAIIANCHKQM